MSGRRTAHSRRTWSAGVVAGICVGMMIALRGWGGAPAPPPAVAVDIHGPRVATVGEPVDFVIRTSAPDIEGVTVLVINATGVTPIAVEINHRAGIVRLGSELMEHAGVITVQVGIGATATRRHLRVEPGPVVEPLASVVGQRTLVVGSDLAMIVAAPADEFGNAVADGQVINATIRYPDGTATSLSFRTQDLIGHAWFDSSTRTGLGAISLTTASTVSGHVLEFEQVAGPPMPFELQIASPPQWADGRTLLRVRTGVLVDRYGNTVPDGVSARVVASAPDGWTQTVGVVVDGHVHVTIPAPTIPGLVIITAEVAGVLSSELAVFFDNAVEVVPLQLIGHGAGSDNARIEVLVGPVRMVGGGYVPDGTPAVIDPAVAPDIGNVIVLRDGVGSFWISPADLLAAGIAPSELRVTVLGTSNPTGDTQP